MFLDVDAKDAGAGMSCPPAPFTLAPYLAACRGRLSPAGCLVVNCSARDPAEREKLCASVREVFGRCWVGGAEEEDSINVVVVGEGGEEQVDVVGAMARVEEMCKGVAASAELQSDLEEGVASFKEWTPAAAPAAKKGGKKKSGGKKKKKK